VPLVFKKGNATAAFLVKAQSLGVSYNPLDAMVALPDVYYTGYTDTNATELLVAYHVPAAASYDWSGTPAAALPERWPAGRSP
jgi:hypothetical protein